jgi:DHA1 family bicyclomycin/chloramphenicol resistance-like MFS transporter
MMHKATHERHDLWILVILSALMSFSSISMDMYLPALPTLVTDLTTDVKHVELTVSTFLLGFSLAQLIWGPVGDRYGRRLPIALSMLLFCVGSVGCAMSGSIEQILVWRVIQAIGACAGPVLARAMVRDLYAQERSAQMLSVLILMMAIAPLLGPLVGGQLLTIWSWRAIFWVLAACGLIGCAGILTLPETLPRERRRIEPVSQMLANYLRLLCNPRLIGYALVGAFFYGGCYAFIAGTPFAYVDYYHVPARLYGFLVGGNIIGLMLMNYVNTRLIPKFGSERLLHFGCWIAAASGVVLAIDAHFGWGGIFGLAAPIFCFMSVSGLIVANSLANAMSAFPQQAGAVSSLIGAAQYGSGIFSAAMLGWFADGTPWTMGWIVAAAGVGCLISALWHGSNKP